MSLSSALSIAMSGLTANQAGLAIVSSNVANASTPGYVTETVNQSEAATGGAGTGVTVSGITRALDSYVQTQLRTETSGGGYADQISSVLTQLQNVYGTPGGQGTLENAYGNLTTAVQALSSNSGAYSAQSAVVTAAQNMAQQLNSATQGIQALRTGVQQDISTSVATANTALTQIASLNSQLQGLSPSDPGAATLEDQRDTAINQLSKLMGVSVTTNNNNQVTVLTTSGVELVGAQASTLSFSGPSTLNASSLYSTNPAQNGVGTITLTSPGGSTTDMSGSNAISSGQIGADIQLRDTTLVQAQTQVDQLAASMSSALSDTTTSGSAVTSGSQAGFTLDLSNMQPGNTINLTYTNPVTNAQQQVSIVAVNSNAVLPLQNTGAPNTTVIGVNISAGTTTAAGMTSIVNQLNAALGTNLQFSNPSGSTLQVLNNGGNAVVNSASATITTSSLTSGSAPLPLFTDGNSLYTGAITTAGSQMTGYAGRIVVNPAVIANPASLTDYSASTASGDATRANYINSQLTTGSFTYSPQTGLGSSTSPFTGTISNYMSQFLSQQANGASNATQLQKGQDVVVNTLQQSYDSTTGVNMDTQMSNLISLQNAYSANAHVMAVVQSMFTALMQVQT